METTDYTLVGHWVYPVTATDTASGLIDNTYYLSLDVTCRVTGLTISPASISDVSHILNAGFPATPIPLPTISTTPPGCLDATIVYEVVATTNYTPLWIDSLTNSISTLPADDPGLQGNYTIQATISAVAPDVYRIVDASVIPQVITFNVELVHVQCTITAIEPLGTINSNLERYISDPSTSFAVPSFVVSPPECAAMYSVALFETTTGVDDLCCTWDFATNTGMTSRPHISWLDGNTLVFI
jgi:hypothetical protein